MAISGSGKSPLSSQIIGGRYRVECCIASGVEANVVGAVDTTTGKRVALKCWDGPTSEQEVAAIQCFMRSANVFGLFENPHVVEVFGTELGDTVSYSVTEWLEGSTLAREVERLGRLTVRDALRQALPCLRAIAEAHTAGIVHGDIRPAHIFLCRAKRHLPERARVFDFGRGMPGFSELRLPARGAVDELCRYTPPELLSGGLLDARSDIYAFGLMLYEVTTGERVFLADDLRDLLREIEKGERRDISEVTQSLPRGFVEVLYRAMAVNPEQRYQDASAFLDALTPYSRNYVAQTDVYVAPSTLPAPLPKGVPGSKETRAYPSRGPWISSSGPVDQEPAAPPAGPLPKKARPARVTLSRIARMSSLSTWRNPAVHSDKIIIPRSKPIWQAAAVVAFFGVSYLALDQGVKGSKVVPAADKVTSSSAASDSQHADRNETRAPIDAANIFDPLPVPSVNDNALRETIQPIRFSGMASASVERATSDVAPTRRARRAERRRAAAAARAVVAVDSSKDLDEHEPEGQQVETRRRMPEIDETIPATSGAPPIEHMLLQ